MMEVTEIKKRLIEVFSKYVPQRIENMKGCVRAAVLVPLFWKDGCLHVLLIKRAEDLEHHPGEIAFPGGIIEVSDKTPQEAALREAFEEVGLDPQRVELLGKLDEVLTSTNFIITPFVGFIPYPYPFKIDGKETKALFILPLKAFKKEKATPITVEGRTFLSYDIGEGVVWGATAKILSELVELLSSSKILCTA
jgi:8-oxo-dGTP pyrophosphatase MutT (NUDIX family)